MLPTDRALTPEEIAQVARDFKRWMKESRRPAIRIARDLGAGFSASVLSQFCGNAYKGDMERIARAVNEYMERQARAADVARPKDFVETEVARRILTVCLMAIDTRGIGVIFGPSGTGKTKTLEAAHKMHTGSLLVRAMESTKRAPGLMHHIAGMLAVPARKCTAHVQGRIIEALKGTGRPIIVDEAHKLLAPALEALRDIHDAAEVPLILAGTIDLKKHVNDTELFYGQFNSRIVASCDITEPALRPRNPRPLFTVDEIVRIFAVSDKLKLSRDGADYLTMLANVPGLGGLRLCKQLVFVAARIAARKSESVTADLLRRVLRQMHGAAYTELVAERAERLQVKSA